MNRFVEQKKARAKDLEDAFRREVFALLEKEGMITDFVIDNMICWHHSGFLSIAE